MAPPGRGLRAALPTRPEAETLLRYLPGFDAPGRTFVKRWHGGLDETTGIIKWPFPEYDDDVRDFFEIVASSDWTRRDYLNDHTVSLASEPAQLTEASAEEICDVLTYCYRRERFCDGHQETMLAEGVVQAALRRLGQLLDRLPAG